MREPTKLIADAVSRDLPSLSQDGSRLAYVAYSLEGIALRVRELSTGVGRTLLRQGNVLRAKISPDGTTVAYNVRGNNEREDTIYLVQASGGEARKLCGTCGLLYDWSPDGKDIIFRSGNPMKFSLLSVASGQQRVVLADATEHIHGLMYSPDQRWMAFHYAPNPGSPRAIYIAPVRDGHAADKSEWIAVMDRPGRQTRPWWSPDGNMLYFISTSGGKFEIWVQRLHPFTKRPVGEPNRLYSPPREKYSINTGTWFGPGIGPHNLIFPKAESTSNIWIAE